MDSKRRRQNTSQNSFKRTRAQNPLDFRDEDNRFNRNDIIPPWEDFKTIIHLINNGEQLPTTSYDCDQCNSEACTGCGPRN